MSINCIIIYSKYEHERIKNVSTLISNFDKVYEIEAIYPKYTRIPFLDKLLLLSKTRTNQSILPSEIGVLLSHRKAWRYIIEQEIDPNKHYLILESDSIINDDFNLKKIYQQIEQFFDLFFWGAWEGNVSIFNSTKKNILKEYNIGEPYIKSVYCTYGYSLNTTAAKLLLKRTQKVSYPVDLFKKFINRLDLRIGAITPEIISNNQSFESSVRVTNLLNKMKHILTIRIFSLRNNLITYFN